MPMPISMFFGKRGVPSPACWVGCRQSIIRQIGRRYILTAFIFLLIGGIEALLMRLQLAKPENTFLSRQPLQPDLHTSRHHDDVSFRGTGNGGDGDLSRPFNGRNAQRCLPATECLRLLDVSCGRTFFIRLCLLQHDPGCRMVCISSARPDLSSHPGKGWMSGRR